MKLGIERRHLFALVCSVALVLPMTPTSAQTLIGALTTEEFLGNMFDFEASVAGFQREYGDKAKLAKRLPQSKAGQEPVHATIYTIHVGKSQVHFHKRQLSEKLVQAQLNDGTIRMTYDIGVGLSEGLLRDRVSDLPQTHNNTIRAISKDGKTKATFYLTNGRIARITIEVS